MEPVGADEGLKGSCGGSSATKRHFFTEHIYVFVSFQVLIKPKPVFQAAVVSEQTRQLVTETLQQVTRSVDISQGQTSSQEGSTKDESGTFTEPSSLAGETSHGSTQGKCPHL